MPPPESSPDDEDDAWTRLSGAVTAAPVLSAVTLRQMHAFVCRELLRRGRREERVLRRALHRLRPRHPPGFRNATWPGGLRSDAGLAPPAPASRFDHARWTRFNATHAFMPDDRTAVRPLAGADLRALRLVLRDAWALLAARHPTLRPDSLVEGLRLWEPARGLRYRLLLRLRRDRDDATELRLVEALRPLGAARLVAAPYQTESARLAIVLPVAVTARGDRDRDGLEFLRRYETACLQRDGKTSLTVVLVATAGANVSVVAEYSRAAEELRRRYRDAAVDVVRYPSEPRYEELEAETEWARTRWRAVRWAMTRAGREALVLVATPEMDWNEDFLNRARINSLPGKQWFSPVLIMFVVRALYRRPF